MLKPRLQISSGLSRCHVGVVMLWFAFCLLGVLGYKFFSDGRGFTGENTSAFSPHAHDPKEVSSLPAETPLIGLNPREQRPPAFKPGPDISTGPADVVGMPLPLQRSLSRPAVSVVFVLPHSPFSELWRARAPPLS